MKQLCAIFLACLLALPSQAAVAIAGSGAQIFTGTAASGTSCSVTVSGITAGDLLYLAMAWTAPATTVSSANDGLGHNFTQIDATTGGSFAAGYHGYLNNVSSSITAVGITSSGSVSCAAIVVEFSGQDSTTPVNGTAKGCVTTNATNTAIPTTASLSSAAVQNDYVVNVSGNFNYPATNWNTGGTGAVTLPSGYAVQKINNQTTGNGTAHTVVGGAAIGVGGFSGQISLSPGAAVSTNGCTLAAVIKAASGGGGATPQINKRRKLDKFDLAGLMRWEMDRWR